MAKRTVGVQLIIFGKRVNEDLAGVLDDVAKAGFQAVETGFLANLVAGKDLKKMLDDRGLVHVGAHFGGHLCDQIGPVIDWLQETGGTDIPLSDLETRELSAELYDRKARTYNEAGRLAKKSGITVSYHNHSWELGKIDGEPGIERLYRNLDNDACKACIDTYWVRDGGLDPAAFVTRHADRLRILHAKDSFLQETGKRSFCPVGEGVIDFPAVLKAMKKSKAPWIVVEEDGPREGTNAAGESTISRANLARMMA